MSVVFANVDEEGVVRLHLSSAINAIDQIDEPATVSISLTYRIRSTLRTSSRNVLSCRQPYRDADISSGHITEQTSPHSDISPLCLFRSYIYSFIRLRQELDNRRTSKQKNNKQQGGVGIQLPLEFVDFMVILAYLFLYLYLHFLYC